MGFYAQVIVPLLCDFGLDRPFVARYRRELLAHASGNILEIGFGTGLNLPFYAPHVRKVTTVDPNVGCTAGHEGGSSRRGSRLTGGFSAANGSPSRTAPSIAPSAPSRYAASSRWTKRCGKCTAC